MTKFKIGNTVRVKVLDRYHLDCCERYAGREGKIVGFTNCYSAKYTGMSCPMVEIEGASAIYYHPDDLELIEKNRSCFNCKGYPLCCMDGYHCPEDPKEQKNRCCPNWLGDEPKEKSEQPTPEPKLCPLRTRKIEMGEDEGYDVTEFLPCVGEKCSWWVNKCAIPLLAGRSFKE